MSIIEPKNSSTRPLRWVVFCAAIDNFGDIGVCWRLLRQLYEETGAQVELWVDDWDALAWFLRPLTFSGASGAICAGVNLHHWQNEPLFDTGVARRIASADVVIEAFACDIPQAVVAAMRNSENPALWLNLEYLSAQPWVRDCHLLPSMQGGAQGRALNKYFFFPGFGEGTGGLLREHDLLQRHANWQEDIAAGRRQLLASYPQLHALLSLPELLVLSMFTYDGTALRSVIGALIESDLASLCFVPEGRSLRDIALCFGMSELPLPGSVLQRGSLTVCVLPFMAQQEYDHLLSLCDFNFVRGEDSFVRAQFAARPLLWHLYPQSEEAHLEKLEAFLDLYCSDSAEEGALKAFWRGWNQGEDCRELWHYLRPQLPSLQIQARRWQQQLAEKPDLVANLLAFYHAKRESKPLGSDCS